MLIVTILINTHRALFADVENPTKTYVAPFAPTIPKTLERNRK